MTLPTIRPLSFGEILDGAFTLYRRNFPRFLGTSALLMSGMVAGMFLVGIVMGYASAVLPLPLLALVILPAIAALVTTVWTSLTWLAAKAYEGKPSSVGDTLEAGLIGAIPLLGSAGIALAATSVAVAVVIMGGTVLQLAVEGTGSLVLGTLARPIILSGVAAVFLFAATLLFAVVPAAVLEEKGPWESIARSMELGRGGRLRILGLLVVAWLIVTLPSLAPMALTGGFAQLANPQAAAALGMRALVVQQLLSLLVGIVTAPFLPAVMVLTYYDRRVRTEALDVQMAASRLEIAGA